MAKEAGGHARRFASRRSFGVAMVVAAMLLAAVLATAGLDNHLFWDDEANTAIYGRNLLKFGRLTAWDGRNLVGYSFGGALGEDLGRELRVPPLSAYVAAAGLRLFAGPNLEESSFKELTFAGRIPFVAAGVLSVGLLAIWLRRHFGRRFPWWLPPLVLALSPAYLLYIRNCRYYALGVMFTLLVWIFWAPGSSRRGSLVGSPRSLVAWLSRCLGAALAVLLLLSTHYLNAVAVLVTLPLFFFDLRYRQPKQYVLWGVIYAVAVAYGLWIWNTANPFAAEYDAAEEGLVRWRHFLDNAAWFIRDLGTHEFVPWAAVLAFWLPWLPWLPLRLRRLRPLARRGWTLVAVVLVYAVTAAYFTPSDMGKGPTAEIRYVVPLIAVGSVLGGLALLILWRWYRPLAAAGFLLLVTTNLPHLGFLVKQFDRTQPWCAPTLCRYVYEIFHDYETGNEEMIDLLAQLPEGTTVRIWDFPHHPIMVYPAMFYAAKLRYCDQLEPKKKIDVELVHPAFPQPTPDYLLRDHIWPEVWLVTPDLFRQALYGLRAEESYQANRALRLPWYYTSKPEIPGHYFSPPPPDSVHFQNMIVMVASDSPLIDHPALTTDMTNAEAVCRWGLVVEEEGPDEIDRALALIKKAVEIDPNCLEARFHLGRILKEEGEAEEAVEHLEAAVRLDPQFVEGHRNLGVALQFLQKYDKAHHHFQKALELRPHSPVEHYNLGNILACQGATEQAMEHFRTALKYRPDYVPPRVNLGIALFAEGKVDQAVAHYRRALEMQPNHVEAHANLGIALKTKSQALDAEGQTQEAQRLREEAVKELGEALKRILPDRFLAAEIRSMLYDALRTAQQQVPPDQRLAEKIRRILEKNEELEKSLKLKE
jgi:tetratricopeptide (TPR) repeat protein